MANYGVLYYLCDMVQINKIDIPSLAGCENSGLITHHDFALNRGVHAATAVGRIMKIGEPYRFVENRIVRVLVGRLRISVNLEEYCPSAGEALYIGQNSVADILDYSPDTVVDLLGFALSGESANIRNVNFLSEECNSWLETYFQLLYALATTQPFDDRSIEHLLQSLHCRIVRTTGKMVMPHHRPRVAKRNCSAGLSSC